MGYIYGHVEISNYTGKISVIQGENDKYGSEQDILNDFDNCISEDKSLVIVPKADHSYRDERKEPIYQSEVLELL